MLQSSQVRIGWIYLVLPLAMAVCQGVAQADECGINVEHITFNNTGPILSPSLQLVLFENNLECVDLVVDNRTLASAGAVMMTLQSVDPPNGALSDSLVMFNATNGPSGATAMNLCFWSDDDGTGNNRGRTCDAMGPVAMAAGEMLSSGAMTDTVTKSPWIAFLFSDPLPAAGLPAGCPSTNPNLSDCGAVMAIPEPGTLWLLAIGFACFASRVRSSSFHS